MKPSVSIIVAAWNAEAFLPRCLNSVIGQGFEDFELLLVDDGSSDGTGAIADSYAAKDARIRVYHTENQGVAAARQLALDKACGLYSIHLDADDWAEPGSLAAMLEKAQAERLDVLFTDFMVEQPGRSRISRQDPRTRDSLLIQKMLLDRLHGSFLNKLIRTGIYRERGVRLPLGLSYAEDQLTMLQLFSAPLRVGYLPLVFAHYDQSSNPASLTRPGRRTLCLRQLDFWRRIPEAVEIRPLERDYYGLLCRYAFYALYRKALEPGEYSSLYRPLKGRLARCKSPLWRKAAVACSLSASYRLGFLLSRFSGKLHFTLARLFPKLSN